MKKRLYCLLLVGLLAVSIAVLPARAAEKDEAAFDSFLNESASGSSVGVFAMLFELEEVWGYSSAFLACDKNGNVCIVSDPGLKDYVGNGVVLAGENYSGKAEYLGTDGTFLYLQVDRVSDLNAFSYLEIGTSLTADTKILFQKIDENGNGTGVYYLEADLSQWEAANGRYENQSQEMDIGLLGAPVISSDGRVTAYAGFGSDSCMAVYPCEDYEFPDEYVIGTVERSSEGSGSGSSGGSGSSTEMQETIGWQYLVLIGGAALLFWYYRRKKQPKEQKVQPAASPDKIPGPVAEIPVTPAGGSRIGDIPLEGGTVIETPKGGTTVPMDNTPLWQLRALNGIHSGKVFPLDSDILLGRSSRCYVSFPEGTPGVSSEHCKLTVASTGVYILDLQSTYGTVLNQGTRLSANTPYPLRSGDTFFLGSDGQSFRLEKAGESPAPRRMLAVRREATGELFRSSADQLTFGRRQDHNVPLGQQEVSISGSHCILYRKNGQLYLMDSGSVNGTFLGHGTRLQPKIPYAVQKGSSFYLTNPQYTFTIVSD